MKTSDTRLRDETLIQALERALDNPRSTAELFDRLRRASGLPGPRHAAHVVRAVAGELAARAQAGATLEADRLIGALLAFDARKAPYGHVDEFIALCGVATVGDRAATDPAARSWAWQCLREAAEDERLRVRTEAAAALARISAAVRTEGGDPLPILLEWLDSDDARLPAAVIESLTNDDLTPLLRSDELARILDAAFGRLSREHRAGRRGDAWQRFAKSLGQIPVAMIARHPELADTIVQHVDHNDDEALRDAVSVVVIGLQKAGQRGRAEPLEKALKRTQKPTRDPRHDRIPKKGRGR